MHIFTFQTLQKPKQASSQYFVCVSVGNARWRVFVSFSRLNDSTVAMKPYLFHTCVIYLKRSNKMAAQNLLSSGFKCDFVRLSRGNRGNGCTDFHETLSSDE